MSVEEKAVQHVADCGVMVPMVATTAEAHEMLFKEVVAMYLAGHAEGVKDALRCFFGKCEIVPVRIIPASDPTAAEARAEVIRELREWEAEQHTVWMASLGQLFVEQVLSDLRANLTELERVK